MHVVKSLCCAAAITILAASGAHADEWNKKTYLTFSGPVQIPGTTLPAGTYLFQLADPDNARHVVMVASKDGKHIYGMFLTIPDERTQTPSENIVMFKETAAGAPQAVEAWWYPGDASGEEFVYPKRQAILIAKANHKPVLATETAMDTSAPQHQQMSALRGSTVGRVDENGNTNATVAPAPSTTVNGNTSTSAPSAAGTSGTTNATPAAGRRRATLPGTASNLPLLELLSVLSLAAGFSLRRVRADA
jgi:hypothetical protein